MRRRHFLKTAAVAALQTAVIILDCSQSNASALRPDFIFVHYGVGSEEWSVDGLTRRAAQTER